MAPINRGFLTAGVLTVIGTALVALAYVGNDDDQRRGWRMLGAVVIGLVLAQVVSRLTEYFTSTETAPGAGDRRGGPHRPGHDRALGHQLRPRVDGVRHHRHRRRARRRHRPRRRQHPVHLLPGGPHRHGHARHHRRRRVRGHLRSRWPTTPPASPRCRASSAARPSGSWSASTRSATPPRPSPRASPSARRSSPRSRCSPRSSRRSATSCPTLEALAGRRTSSTSIQINVADPKTFIGLLIGGSIAFMFSALAIRAVGRTAGVVVQEVRRQFADGGIMAGTKKPDYGPVIDICTAASLRELATPALLAVLTPVIIGFGINFYALGAFLAAVILTGQLMANFLSQLRWRVGQRQEVHRGRPRGRQGLRGPQGRGHRRHRRRPVQGHRRPGAQPADQGDEPGVAADPAGGHQPAGQRRRPLRHRRRRAGGADRRHRLLQARHAGDGSAVGRRPSRRRQPDELAVDALDRWIVDLGDEDADLRAQLRAAKPLGRW